MDQQIGAFITAYFMPHLATMAGAVIAILLSVLLYLYFRDRFVV